MYIPVWLIVVGAIVFFLYTKSKKQEKQYLASVPNTNISNFSYKLEIRLNPWWHKLYKKISNPEDESLWEKETKKKVKNLKTSKEYTDSLFGRRYIFTEYYDSTSGLVTRFQRFIYPGGMSGFYPVDKFGDQGYVFHEDSSWGSDVDIINETDEQSEKRERLKVRIGEDFINNTISEYETNTIVSLPLDEIVNFRIALGLRFPGAESNRIIKWPDSIEKRLKESGFVYETQIGERESEELDIKAKDSAFFEQWGSPRVSLFRENSNFSTGFFEDKDKFAEYTVTLEVFRPGENNRIW